MFKAFLGYKFKDKSNNNKKIDTWSCECRVGNQLSPCALAKGVLGTWDLECLKCESSRLQGMEFIEVHTKGLEQSLTLSKPLLSLSSTDTPQHGESSGKLQHAFHRGDILTQAATRFQSCSL